MTDKELIEEIMNKTCTKSGRYWSRKATIAYALQAGYQKALEDIISKGRRHDEMGLGLEPFYIIDESQLKKTQGEQICSRKGDRTWK